jgi:plastocyanin
MRVGWWLGAVLLALSLGLAGCGGQAEQPSVSVGMFDNFYARDVTRVPAGTPVVFENKGYAPHNAVAVDGAFRTQETIGPDQTGTVVAALQPGVYRFYCTFHAGKQAKEGMVATLVVGDVPYDPGKGTRGTGVAATAKASGATRRVPEDYRTIQAAVDAAKPGDLVLVGPGVYREEVKVRTPSLVLRGRDRNAVVVDGEFKRANAISVTADGVAVENLTVRNAKVNGLFWTGVKGYRASFVSAVNNEVYGVYAFDSTDGLFERSWASGSYDAGFYIGQCKPCDAVIDGVTAESNGLGYSGTNAGGNLHIVRSVWRHNVGGIVPNTLDTELLPPFKGVDVVGNLVEGNGSRTAPARGLQWSSFGNGIILAGGDDSRVERNLILNHLNHGVLVTPNTDRRFWISSGNRVRDNLVRGSGRADLALSGPAGPGNCFAGNDVRSTLPVGLELFQPCRGLRLPVRMDFSTALHSLGSAAEGNTDDYPHVSSRDVPPPPAQPQLPGGAAAPVRPAVNVYTGLHLDLDAIARHVRRAHPGQLGLAAGVRPVRLRAAVRALRRLDLAGPVGPGPARGPRPGGHGRLDPGDPGGAVSGRGRLPRRGSPQAAGLAAADRARRRHRRLPDRPGRRRIPRRDRLAVAAGRWSEGKKFRAWLRGIARGTLADQAILQIPRSPAPRCAGSVEDRDAQADWPMMPGARRSR